MEATRLNLPAWVPHRPHEQQQLALIAPRFVPADVEPVEIFYGGAAGGGKSDWLLMSALQYADVPGYSALLLRRTYTELEQPGALIPRAKEWLSNTAAAWNEQRRQWTFPSGATLAFGYLESDDHVYRYQSAEFQFIGFDELTKFPEKQYEYMFSRIRKPSTGPLSRVPLRMAAASNPGGVGHTWVKHRFVDPTVLPPGRIFVPAKLDDNPSLERGSYVKSLMHLGDTLREQLLDGDWSAFEGAAFVVTPDHFVAPFDLVPQTWGRFESMDYGISNPTVWLWWLVDHEGNLVIADEFSKPALPSESAPIVLARRQTWKTTVCHGDPSSLSMRTSTLRFGEPATIQTEFADRGINVQHANNDPVSGYTRLRELLKLDEDRRFPDWHPRRGEYGAPRLFVVKRACPQLAEQLEVAPLQPLEKRQGGEKIDPDWEGPHGHAVAAARYGAMSRPSTPSEPVPVSDNPRTIALLEYERRIEQGRSIDRTYAV